MNYEIIDNFLPKSEFKTIKNIIFDAEFPWLYEEIKGDASGIIKKHSQFKHQIYTQNIPISPFFENLAFLCRKLDCKSLLNMSCDMVLGGPDYIDRKINPTYPFPNTTAIFYLNNSNGYTLLEEDVKIENIENRILLFDGSKEYINSNCTDSSRKVTISLNYI
jgi:hypothetical protein